MLTSAALVSLRLSWMLHAFVLNELTESLIDWNPTYFSTVLIKFVFAFIHFELKPLHVVFIAFFPTPPRLFPNLKSPRLKSNRQRRK